MPCYTVSEASLDLGLRKANLDALKNGMTSLGYSDVSFSTLQTVWRNRNTIVTFDRENGLVVNSDSNNDIESLGKEINQAYTSSVVQLTAKKFGWQVQAKGQNQFMVTKR